MRTYGQARFGEPDHEWHSSLGTRRQHFQGWFAHTSITWQACFNHAEVHAQYGFRDRHHLCMLVYPEFPSSIHETGNPSGSQNLTNPSLLWQPSLCSRALRSPAVFILQDCCPDSCSSSPGTSACRFEMSLSSLSQSSAEAQIQVHWCFF